MTPEHIYRGQCHCGAIALEFVSAREPEQWAVRACQCRFCRAHGARTAADPAGRATIRVSDPGALIRYRFAEKTADFLVCRVCGVYMAAMLIDGDNAWATLNVNCFENADAFPKNPAPVSYDGEDAAARIARRKTKWTPARLIGAD